MPTKTYLVNFKEKGGKRLEKQTGKINTGLKSLASQAIVAGGAFFAARGIINGIKSSIDLFGKQEAAEKKLEIALGHTSQALLNQAKALQQQTAFGDETIIEAQSLIAAFVDEEDQIKAATKATLDLAAAKGFDLVSAADLVSKTLGSSTNALSRYGIEVTGAVGSTERLSSLTSNVADKFGGQAAGAAETMAGKIEQMKNAVGDAAEAFGSLLVPIVVPLAEGLKLIAEGASDIINAFNFREKVAPELIGVRTELDIFKETVSGLTLGELAELKEQIETDLPEGYTVLTDANQLLIDKYAVLQQAILDTGVMTDEYNELQLRTIEGIDNEIIKTGELEKVKTKHIDLDKARIKGEQLYRQEKEKSVIQDLKAAALQGQNARDAMLSVIRAETMEAVAGLVSSILKSVPFPFNLIAAAGAGGLAASIMDKALASVPKFAQGTDFITQGPQMVVVGDNPGGREHVQVTPISSPNVNGPSGNNITLNFHGPADEDYVNDVVIPNIQKALRYGTA